MGRNLKSKAFYTSLTKGFNIFLSFAVQFIITPIILNGLGKQLYGVFTIVNKLHNYVSIVDLRPAAILRYKLASLQESRDLITKKEYVGASIFTSLIMFPFIILIGLFLSIVFENYFKVDEAYVEVGRIAIIILSIFLGIRSLLGIPESIIKGNNLEYKTFFIEPIRLIAYGFLVYLFLLLGFGLLGVIFAIVLAGFLDFIIKLFLQKKIIPGYFPIYPNKSKKREFLSQGTWYTGSSFFTQVLNSLDIIIIGVVFGAKEVTIYALSKAMLFRVSESVISIVGGITSGVGHLISAKRDNELIRIREYLLRFNLIVGSLIVTYFVLFNSSFVALWVDQSNFIGEEINLVLCISAFLVMICLSDEIFINSLQLFKKKSKVILLSVVIYVVLSITTVKILGLIAIPLGFLLAKSLQWIYYQYLLQKKFKINLKKILLNNLKVTIIPILFLGYKYLFGIPMISNWFYFIVASIIVFILFLSLTLLFVLKKDELNYLLEFLKTK